MVTFIIFIFLSNIIKIYILPGMVWYGLVYIYGIQKIIFITSGESECCTFLVGLVGRSVCVYGEKKKNSNTQHP